MENLLNQTCKIYSGSTLSKYGKVTWGTYQTLACRFAQTYKHYKNSQGNEISVTSKFQLSSQSVDIGTRIDFGSKSYKVTDVKDWVDADGDIFGCVAYCSDYPV